MPMIVMMDFFVDASTFNKASGLVLVLVLVLILVVILEEALVVFLVVALHGSNQG